MTLTVTEDAQDFQSSKELWFKAAEYINNCYIVSQRPFMSPVWFNCKHDKGKTMKSRNDFFPCASAKSAFSILDGIGAVPPQLAVPEIKFNIYDSGRLFRQGIWKSKVKKAK